MTKQLYIIGGCNGAGKTTASYTVLPDILNCRNFVNADEIAKGISPFAPGSVAIEAGKIMLSNIKELLSRNETFSIETTLAARSYTNLIAQAKKQEYNVSLLYFWLESPQLAIDRVKQRVQEGGHNIPEDVIIRRYHAGINNLFKLFILIVDSWYIIDNSNKNNNQSVIIAKKGENSSLQIVNTETYNQIKSYVR